MKRWVKIAVPIVCALCSVVVGAVTRASELPEIRGISQTGGTREIVLASRLLGQDRTLLVRLPRDYETGTDRYPVLFLLDAEWHFNIAAADVELLSECSYATPHPIPELIVVGVVNPDRNRDFTPTSCPVFRNMRFPTSGGAAAFRRFLVEELLPTIDRKYRTHPYRILAGWSLGGLFTIDTLLSDTPVFDSYLAISPSLWWDDEWILKRLGEIPEGADHRKGKQLTVTLGSAEKGSMVEGSTRAFLGRLADHPLDGATVEEVPIEGLGHNYSPKMAYFLGLASFFADWNLPREVRERGLEAIDSYYASLGARYHFEVPVPEDVYGDLGWRLFEAEKRDEAGEVFRAWTTRHPRSPVAMASLGSFYREVGEVAQAVAMLRAAIEAEKESARPRQGFLLDLQRDVDSLTGEE